MNSIKKALCPLNIGIALVISGVPIGMYLNDYYKGIKWSPIIMIISIILIVEFRNLLNLKFPFYSKLLGFMVIYQMICLVYGSFSNAMDFQLLSFHFYIICLCVAVSTVSVDKAIMSYKQIATTTFLVSMICCLCGAVYTTKGLVVGDEAWAMRNFDNFSIEPFTVASGSLVNYFAGLVLLSKKRNFFSLIIVIAMLLDFYVILFTSKRTPLFVLVIGSLFLLYVRGYLQSAQKLLRYITVIFLISVALYSFEEIQTRIDDFVYNMYAGVLNMFGDYSVVDLTGSAGARDRSREWAFNYMDTHPDFTSYIFGWGYMTHWLDNPLLQSYLDMGIIGLISYFYFIVLYPVKNLLKKPKDKTVQFALLTTLYAILSIMNSGIPYMQIKYSPIVILSLVIGIYKKQIKKIA